MRARWLRVRAAAALAGTAIFTCCAVLACDASVDLENHHSASSSTGGDPSCPDQRADCDMDGTCETTLGTADDCGACGDVCNSVHGAAKCVNGGCVSSCDAGFADCDATGENGCESQLASDPHNCGACGKDCGDGDCVVGSCVVVLAQTPAAFVGADSLVLENGYLDWATPSVDGVDDVFKGEVARVTIAGGVASTLAIDGNYPFGLVSNGTDLFWSDATALGFFRYPLPNGPAAPLLATSPYFRVQAFAVDAKTIYFAGYQSYESAPDLLRMPVDGSAAPEVIATGFTLLSGGALSGDDLYVADVGPEIQQGEGTDTYWGNPNATITRISLSTLQSHVVAQNLDTASAVAVHDGSLYWIESGSLATYSANGNEEYNRGTYGRIVRANLDGTNPTVLVDGLAKPLAMAFDQAHVYVSAQGSPGGVDPSTSEYEPDGLVGRVPLDGGAMETLFPFNSEVIAVDDTAVYAGSNLLGIIVRIAK
ncbi:MAG: hypothetical protein U0414_02625 [Polyangiaceae bacterium]